MSEAPLAKFCPACRNTYALNAQHFYRRPKKANGEERGWHKLCHMCWEIRARLLTDGPVAMKTIRL